MALKYELMSSESRIELWKLFFGMYKENDRKIRFDTHAMNYVKSDEVANMQLNGREIRNGMRNESLQKPTINSILQLYRQPSFLLDNRRKKS